MLALSDRQHVRPHGRYNTKLFTSASDKPLGIMFMGDGCIPPWLDFLGPRRYSIVHP
jgi:hypothetical protein